MPKTNPTIVVSNQKGGVGKTTTACAVADGMRRAGLKVLGIDLDFQGNFSALQKRETLEGTCDATGFCTGGKVLASSRGATVPAGEEVQFLADDLGGKLDLLSGAIERAFEEHGFDACVIDTHPDRDFATQSALYAATHVVIPSPPEPLGRDAFEQEMAFLDDLAENFSLDWEGRVSLLYTFVKRATRTHRAMMGEMDATASELGVKVLSPKISSAMLVPDAQRAGVSIYEMGGALHGPAMQYEWAVRELVEWTGVEGKVM